MGVCLTGFCGIQQTLSRLGMFIHGQLLVFWVNSKFQRPITSMAQHHGGPNVSPALMCEQYKLKTTHHAGSGAGILKHCNTSCGDLCSSHC